MKPYKTLLLLLVLLVLIYGPSAFSIRKVHLPFGIDIMMPGLEELRGSWKQAPGDSAAAYLPLTDSLITIYDIPEADVSPGGSISAYSLPDSGSVRILYYGDSQLEGDRITDYLRKELRRKYGGTGPGLLSPTLLTAYTRTAWVRSSPNWERYNVLSYRDNEIDHRRLGPRMEVSRYTLSGSDTTEAWIKVSPSASADSSAAAYNMLRLLYGNLSDSVRVSLFEDRKHKLDAWMVPAARITELKLPLSQPSSIEIRFAGTASPDIYGLSIESSHGLQVDNISLRGSAGYEFTAIDAENLRESYKLLDPDLIILHFGLNVVLNIREDYSYYRNRIYKQLMHIRELAPGADLLLVGVSDMAQMDSSGIRSYPNLHAITGAQKEAADSAGVYFWDARVAMGGEDAALKWHDNDPPLMANDYTHLSYEGGHKFAGLLLKEFFAYPGSPDNTPASADSLILNSGPSVFGDPADSLDLNPCNKAKSLLLYDEYKPLIFTTPAFWLFLLTLLVIYSLVAGKPLVRNTYLLLFSLFFYYKSGGIFFILLLVSTLSDYCAGLLIHSSSSRFVKKLWLSLSLLVNLGMLAYFKYTFFVTGAVNDLAGTAIPEQNWLALLVNNMAGTAFDTSSIILPVGISFFTFQTISYTMDVYRGRTQPVRNILDFGFYVSFFPQLVAGPIVRASEFIPQLYQKFRLSSREWSHALYLILGGLVKKIIISDYIAVNLVDPVFGNPGSFSGIENLLAVYGYGLQIYCDFSGYTDIAIGVALILGFRLPLNFNSPYKAPNITDFWRRWHISLSRWLKDYLYISLGGNRKGRFRTNLNLLITMLLGGLWHGAAWRFIIWGGLHGLGLMLHKGWKRISPFRKGRAGTAMFIPVFITFNFVSFCWIFFRAENMDNVKLIFDRLLNAWGGIDMIGFIRMYYGVIVVILTGYILHFLPATIKESYRGLFIRTPLPVKLLIVYILAIAMYNFQLSGVQPFIYFRF